MFGLPPAGPRRAALLLLSAFWIAAGINHFLNPEFYLRIMPPWLPAHAELVWLSGVAEVVGGAAVLVPRWRSTAGWGLVVLLIAIFPANLHMALNPTRFADIPPLALYLRLPLQLALIWWAWWATRPEAPSPNATRNQRPRVNTDTFR